MSLRKGITGRAQLIFSENLVSVRMHRTVVELNKPIYWGVTVLDLSKKDMYDFWYNYVKPTLGD
jgi:hypothetical protein